MYSQNDLDEAVAAGALSAEAAQSLRVFVERQRALPGADEEHFRLVTGFNDIFVAIAGAILLFAVGWIGQSAGQSLGLVVDSDGPSPLAPLAIAATAWGLALFFTARRRMALPSGCGSSRTASSTSRTAARISRRNGTCLSINWWRMAATRSCWADVFSIASNKSAASCRSRIIGRL